MSLALLEGTCRAWSPPRLSSVRPPRRPSLPSSAAAATEVAIVDAPAPAAAAAVDPDPLPLWQLAAAGSVTTFFADILMHPVDCVKTVQQSGEADMGLGAAASWLWTTAGIAGFFHGFLVYALADAVSGAIKFSVWEAWKAHTAPLTDGGDAAGDADDGGPGLRLPPALLLFAGAALAFVANSVTLVPGEFLKNQLQMQRYASLPEAVAGVRAASGVAGFYQGYEAVLLRDVPYTMLELVLYEIFKDRLTEARRRSRPATEMEAPPPALSAWDEVAAAALTGALTAVATTPLDTVKTKLMVDAEFAGASFAECLATTVHEHGPGAVFAGVLARVAWIVPFTVVYLPTYDALKRLLGERRDREGALTSALALPRVLPPVE